MIIGKRKSKAACASRSILLVFLLAALCLSSCARDGGWLEQLQQLEESASYSSAYRVILPFGAGEALKEKADELALAVKERTNISCRVFYDTQIQRDKKEDVCEILVGRTNRVSSQNALSDWKRDDYVCFAMGDDLIIGAVSESACIAAMDAFCKRCLPYSDCATLMQSGDTLLYEAQYPFDGALLNGTSVGSYTLVYPAGARNSEYDIAVALRNMIADRCGAYPEIHSDDRVPREGVYIEVGACFGSEPDAEQAYLFGEENRIRLYAPDPYGLLELSRLLCGGLFDAAGEGEAASFTVQGKTQIVYESPRITVLNFTADWRSDQSPMAGLAAFSKAISQVDADLILLGAMDEEIWAMAKALLPDTVECQTLALANRQVIPVILKHGVLANAEREIGVQTGDGFYLVRTDLAPRDGHAQTLLYLVEIRDCSAETLWNALDGAVDPDGSFIWVLNGRSGCEALALQAGQRNVNAIRKQVALSDHTATLATLTDREQTVSESASTAAEAYQAVTMMPVLVP